MVIVNFTKPYGNYQANDTAGFNEAQADALVKRGVAVIVNDNAKPKVIVTAQQADEAHGLARVALEARLAAAKK